MTSAERSKLVRQLAIEVGFDLVGISPAIVGLGADRLADWLRSGRHGEMDYMARQQAARSDPQHVLPGVRSIVMVALLYRTREPGEVHPGEGRISRYAWGRDYHDVLRQRLHRLRDRLREADPAMAARGVVDSAPLMERDYARLAGLGWFGKNTLLLHPRLGSWFFLGALLIDQELEYDEPFHADHCGTCTRCLDACPTHAFHGPYQLDPRRCISYLTIEHRSTINEPLRSGMGDWVFGCDVCQEVCPWNQKVPTTDEPAFEPRVDRDPVTLRSLLQLSDQEFRERFRGTPLFRSKRRNLLRNAAIVAGNQRCRELEPELTALLEDPDAVIRDAAQWALDRLRDGDSRPLDSMRV